MQFLKILIKLLLSPAFIYVAYLLGAKGFAVQNSIAADVCFSGAILVVFLMIAMWAAFK